MTFENYMLPCLSENLFGFDCMGCGFQRALLAVFQGQFIEALWLYPAIFPLLLLATTLVLSKFYKFNFHQKTINLLSLISIGTIITNYFIKLTLLKKIIKHYNRIHS